MKRLFPLSLAAGLICGLVPPHGVYASQTGNAIDWSISKSWTMPCQPLDFVQSLDNKKVFVLCDDSQVRVYTPEGKEIGAIPVDKDVSGIDIAPRGEALYLISKSGKSYTAIDVSVTQQIDITGAPFVGNENAPITLVVFSDFQ
jgi:DNA-binding beta-propeller fold protein YncE